MSLLHAPRQTRHPVYLLTRLVAPLRAAVVLVGLVVNVPLAVASPLAVITDSGSSATYSAGTDFTGTGGVHFISGSADPLAPLSGTSVHFRGWQNGGSQESIAGGLLRYLVFRYQIDFDQPVELAWVHLEGAAFNASRFRLLNAGQSVLFDTNWPVFGNHFQSITLDLSGITGQSFFFEEWDNSTFWRYRSDFQVSAVPEPGTFVLLLAGFAPAILLRRRVKR